MNELDIIYVMQTTELCGGHKIIFEHANRLKERGHKVQIFALRDQNDWFDLKVPLSVFDNYEKIIRFLKALDCIKIATFHQTAPVVAECLNGSKGFYLIQDIETNYFKQSAFQRGMHDFVLSTYQLPLTHICESKWVENELKNMGHNPHNIGIAISEKFGRQRHPSKPNQLFYIDRKLNIKDIRFFEKTLQLLPEGFDLITTGQDLISYYPTVNHYPYGTVSEKEIIDIYNNSLCYINTSTHEGFCLPALEAMACGCPVICRNADGNMEHCIDNETALICETPEEMAQAIIKLNQEGDLRNKLIKNGYEMASKYKWDNVIDKLEIVLKKY